MRWSSQTGHPWAAGCRSGTCCWAALRRATSRWPSGRWRRKTLGCMDAAWKFQAGSMTTNTRLLWVWLQVRKAVSLEVCEAAPSLVEGPGDDVLSQLMLAEGWRTKFAWFAYWSSLVSSQRGPVLWQWKPERWGNAAWRFSGLRRLMEADQLRATGWISKANRVRSQPRRCSSLRMGCLVVKGVFCDSASWDTAVITQLLNPDLTHLTLVDLHPAKSYNLRMFATNSVGTSHSSNVLTITTKEAGRVESVGNVRCSSGL